MSRTVRQILAADRPRGTDDDLLKAHADMTALSALLEELFEAARRGGTEDDDWELVYDAIFGTGDDVTPETSIQTRTREALALVGRELPDYCDPDTSYEEDAVAWKGAFDRAHGNVTAMHREAFGGDDEEPDVRVGPW